MFQYETILRGAMRVMYRTEQGETSNTLQAENKSGQNHQGKPSKRQKTSRVCSIVCSSSGEANPSNEVRSNTGDNVRPYNGVKCDAEKIHPDNNSEVHPHYIPAYHT